MMVSVVIPTHNRGNLIERAVNSVIQQTYKALEIIVVSDGSTDNTDEVIQTLTRKDERIRYISYHPAKGGNVARNTGIQAAKYDYIAFLDDDDEWLPEKLEKQMKVFLKDSEIGLVYTGVKSIYLSENTSYLSTSHLCGDLSKKILLNNYIGTTSTVIVKKSALEKSGLFDINLTAMQDYDLWIRICQNSKIGVVSEPCIHYYNHPKYQQISQQIEKYNDAIDYLENKYFDLFINLSNTEKRNRKSNFNLQLAHKAMRNNNTKLAFRYSINSIKFKLTFKALVFLLLSFVDYSTTLKLRKLFGHRLNSFGLRNK